MVLNEEIKTIEEYFIQLDGSRQYIFPHNDNYVNRYHYLSDQLNKWIHPYVVASAITVDGGHLNDHGPVHISRVILRASQIINNSSANLTDYELYILLMAVHIHDVGNILGRQGHEINSIEVIQKYGLNAGQDRIEWDTIFEIAEAHGGDPKDKISELVDEKILDFFVRKRLLAAILKLADELAEDRTRANRFLLISNNLPKEAELYHKYSFCLHSVDIDTLAKQIKLSFDVEEKDLQSYYFKQIKTESGIYEKEVLLIDEIYNRTYKTHLERVYCMRFMRAYVQIDKIRIDIQIRLNQKDVRSKHIKRHIIYDLGEVGYPYNDMKDFFSICPLLSNYSGKKVIEMLNKNILNDVTATY